jgi:hypothetical protein
MASQDPGTGQIVAEEGILLGVGCVHSDQTYKNSASDGESDMHQELLRIEAQIADSNKQSTQEHSGSAEGRRIRPNGTNRAPLFFTAVINSLNHDDLSPDSAQSPERVASITLKSCVMDKIKKKDVGHENRLEQENWSVVVQRSERSDKYHCSCQPEFDEWIEKTDLGLNEMASNCDTR